MTTIIPSILVVMSSGITGSPFDFLTFHDSSNSNSYFRENHINSLQKEYGSLYTELFSYSSLQYGWDGYNGVSPSDEVIQTTESFLNILKEHSVIKPRIMLSGCDEISLFWKSKNNYIEVSIDSKDKFTYFYEIGNELYGEDNLTVEGFIPSRLNSAFSRFSERLNTLKMPNIIKEKSNCNFITENMTYFNQISLDSAFSKFSESLNTLEMSNIIKEESNYNFIFKNMTYFNQAKLY